LDIQGISTLEFSIFMVILIVGGKKKENRPCGAGSSQKAANGVLKNLLAGHPMDNKNGGESG
jgi:hypothetical protein